MAELLEEIKKLSREEQLALADQIIALSDEEPVWEEDEEFKAEVIRRAQHLLKNPSSGYSLEEVLGHLRAQDEGATA